MESRSWIEDPDGNPIELHEVPQEWVKSSLLMTTRPFAVTLLRSAVRLLREGAKDDLCLLLIDRAALLIHDIACYACDVRL